MEPSGVPAQLPVFSAELLRIATDWWRDDDANLLPGEQGGRSVFVLDFWDGCRYFGYTRGSVFARLATLFSEFGAFGSNSFVLEHAARVPYVVRCLASGMTEGQARELRQLLVTQSPMELARSNGAMVRAADCCLAEGAEAGGAETGGSLSFHEAAKLGLLTPGTQDSRYECP